MAGFEPLLLAQITILQNPPRFKGSILTATALSASTNVAYSTISEDTYSGWNSTSHYWAVPVSALYFVTVQVKWGSTTPSSAPGLRINGGAANSTVELVSPNADGTSAFQGLTLTGFVRANAGDQLSVQVLNAGFTTQSDTPADNNYLNIVMVSF